MIDYLRVYIEIRYGRQGALYRLRAWPNEWTLVFVDMCGRVCRERLNVN